MKASLDSTDSTATEKQRDGAGPAQTMSREMNNLKINLCRNRSKGREGVVLIRRRRAASAVAGGTEQRKLNPESLAPVRHGRERQTEDDTVTAAAIELESMLTM